MTEAYSQPVVTPFQTIADMLNHTAKKWPDREAFRQFDYVENAWLSLTWNEFFEKVMRWRRAFHASGLRKGDRVAMLLTNCIDAVTFDQAALANGLIPVPLHAIDTPGSSAYILRDSNARFLVTTSRARWNAIVGASRESGLPDMNTVVFTNELFDDGARQIVRAHPIRLYGIESWLAGGNHVPDADLTETPNPNDVAGFIYTSGTTGRPKGVMLTHRNLVSNVEQINRCFDFKETDVFLSLLPFSHTFERTVSHYNALANGASMAFARSSALERDLAEVKPTIMCLVPRIYEKLYQRANHCLKNTVEIQQDLIDWTVDAGWRRYCRQNDLPVEDSPRAMLDDTVWDKLDADVAAHVRAIFGGRLRATFAGGASLNQTVARFFCAMNVPVQQVYGLTETSPIVSFSRTQNNHPQCVGHPVDHCEVMIGDNDELLVRGPQVMKGYWNRPEATQEAFIDGWFRTGDQADLSDGGRIRIKGRIKEIIVTSSGEKIAPVDIEFAIQGDPLFDQVLVIGEKRPFITALVVVNEQNWKKLCEEMQLDPNDPATLSTHDMQRFIVKRVRAACRNIPQYGVPRAVGITRTPWTVENGLLTPTQKLRRRQILAANEALACSLYAGYEAPQE